MGPSTSPKVNRQGEEGREDHWGLIREETWNKRHLTQSDRLVEGVVTFPQQLHPSEDRSREQVLLELKL